MLSRGGVFPGTLGLCACVSVGPALFATATPTVDVIVLSEQFVPGGGFKAFDVFDGVVMNNAGKIAFQATLTDDTTGVWTYDAVNGLVEVVREGQAGPAGFGNFAGFGLPKLNQSGQVAFEATGTGPAGMNQGVFVGGGVAGPVMLAGAGMAAPGGNGVFTSVEMVSFNTSGQAALLGELTQTAGGTSDDTGLYRAQEQQALIEIVREGVATPVGGTYGGFFPEAFSMNDAGRFVFSTLINNVSPINAFGGMFVADGQSDPTPLLIDTAPAPDGNGLFERLGYRRPVWNDADQAGFLAEFDQTQGGNWKQFGVVRADASGTAQTTRGEDPSPDGNGNFYNFSYPTINNAGQLAYIGNLQNTADQTQDNEGIFIGDGLGPPTQVFREGAPAAGGNGEYFANGGKFLLNDAGQMAVRVQYRLTDNGSNDDIGIAFFDPQLGVIEVAREGDDLLGSRITRLHLIAQDFYVDDGKFGDEHSALNNHGQIAYLFRLLDRRWGIAVWTPPSQDPADLDGDGDVDDADFGIAFAAFTGPDNGPSLNPTADLDRDGDVDDADFGLAFAAFTGPGDAANVPEPTSLAMLSISGLLVLRRWR